MPEPTPAGPGGTDIVARFLQNVRGAVPLSIEQIDVMLQMLEAARGAQHFLDLGCGEAVLSAAILNEHPEARGVLVDVSEPMLAAARKNLRPHQDRVKFIAADFNAAAWERSVASCAPFDAVVSAFAMHHLGDQRKRELFREIHDLLRPEGIFINFEHVASATRWTESVWDDYMIDAIFGEELKASPGKPRAAVAREYYERASKKGEVHAPLEVQCDWLRDIGFESVECFLKVSELAMFGGQKAGETP